MDCFTRKYVKNNLQVNIQIDDDSTFRNIKSGDASVVFRVVVKQDNKIIEGYYFEIENLTLNKFNSVVKSILEEPLYRKTLNQDSNYNSDWVILYTNELGINIECQKQIKRLNSIPIHKLKFKDFANLKTFGRDKYSAIKFDELKLIIDKQDVEKLQSQFQEEEYLLTALRWCARGLKPEYVARKVKTDIEIKQNSKK